jgi:hypothetical protein
MQVKHNKIRNTGILFELLVRSITSDILEGSNTKSLGILKKYFTKTELGKEYKLYETLIKNKNIDPNKADIIISSLLEVSKKLDQEKLKKEKYNLIKEIKNVYNLDEFFKIKLPNYKIYAAFYTLLEISNSNNNNTHLDQLISNKTTLLEYLIESPKIEINKENNILEEFAKYDRDIRILSYKILLENFNEKYKDFNPEQKAFLKEFMGLKDSQPVIKEFYNKKIKEIKSLIKEINSKTKDKATKIKVDGVVMMLSELKKTDKINIDILANLMNYYNLLYELKESNK